MQSYYYLAFCFLEVPTGYIADRFGCRRSMQMGALALLVSHAFPIFLASYGGFLAHFLLLAVARSLVSGAASAYLYESLQQDGAVASYKQIEGNARAWGLIAKVVTWPTVGALMAWHMNLPYWLTGVSALLALFFASYLPDRRFNLQRAISVSESVRALRSILSTPALLLVMIMGVGIFVIGRIVQLNLFQPILEANSFSVTSYGGIMAAMTVVEAVGSARPMVLRRWMTDLSAVFVLTLFIAASMPFMAYGGQPGVVIGLALFALTSGLAFPVQRQLLNDVIVDPRFRATVLSVESIVDRGVTSVAAWMAGIALASGRMEHFLVGSAAMVVVVTGVVFAALRNNKALLQPNH
ncbi:MAG: MFS transporter [Myxococcota bacterium]